MRLAAVALWMMTAAAVWSQAPPAGGLRAGAATSNITPPIGAPIVGGWTAPPSTHIHDELHARALVLDDGATRLAIAVSDNVSISRDVYDEAKRLIAGRTPIRREHILLSATHTHSGPDARTYGPAIGTPLSDYQRFVASRIADAVVRASHQLEPARIGWGMGEEPGQVFHRRWRMKPGEALRNPFGGMDQVRMNPPRGHTDLIEPAGPTDPQIHFLSVQSTAGRPIALLANYSLHYVGGVRGGDISADYFGMFAAEMERLLEARGQDPPFVGILSNGTSANINNIDFRRASEDRKWRPYEKMRAVAAVVAAEVYRRHQAIPWRETAKLDGAETEISMGLRVPSPDQVAWAEAVLRKPKDSPAAHIHERTYAERTLRMKGYPARMPFLLQTLRIGDIGIAAIPAEVFVEIGLEIRKRSPFPQTFTISLANGGYGYLPTVEQHRLGGYETWRGTNQVEIEAAPKIVEALIGLFGRLRAAAQ